MMGIQRVKLGLESPSKVVLTVVESGRGGEG